MARIKLSETVGQFLDMMNYSEAEYSKAYRIAIRGWRQLNWDVTGIPKRVKLPVECDLTVCLDDDVIKVVSVGVVNDKGELATLTENPRLTELDPDSDGYEVSNTFSDNWWNYESNWRVLSWGGSLGVGSQTNIGEYRYDEGSNLIILNPEFCYSQVVVEYLGHEKINGEYTINELASEALLAFIIWQWNWTRKGVGIAEREQYKRSYYNELHKAKVRIKAPRVQEMKQAARRLTMGGLRS